MLIDKGYYDFDYEWFEKKQKLSDMKLKSDVEVQGLMARMGFGTKLSKTEPQHTETTPELPETQSALSETNTAFPDGLDDLIRKELGVENEA